MRKYLLPSALILLLGLGFALAQTYISALQLSQDTTGAFSVDTNNGVYFPSHILTVGTPAPTITGTGTPTITGTDTAGLITMGTSATTAVAVFGRAYLTTPYCIVVPQVTTPIQLTSYVPGTTTIFITQASNSGNKYNYFCTSKS